MSYVDDEGHELELWQAWCPRGEHAFDASESDECGCKDGERDR